MFNAEFQSWWKSFMMCRTKEQHTGTYITYMIKLSKVTLLAMTALSENLCPYWLFLNMSKCSFLHIIGAIFWTVISKKCLSLFMGSNLGVSYRPQVFRHHCNKTSEDTTKTQLVTLYTMLLKDCCIFIKDYPSKIMKVSLIFLKLNDSYLM